ncbi:MAG: DUF1080 domain-containing protein [Myxococcales bacterium]|nr:DUF1080 domain-containing protein [Myxococcales bacterium]
MSIVSMLALWMLLSSNAPSVFAQHHGHVHRDVGGGSGAAPVVPSPTGRTAPNYGGRPVANNGRLQVHQTGHFTLKTDTDTNYALTLGNYLDSYHKQLRYALSQDFQITATIPPTSIILFERQADYQRYAQMNAPRLLNNGGYYDGGTHTIVTYRYNNSMQLYFHEVMHSVMGEIFGDHFFYRYTRPNWPIWFDEGLAEHYGSFSINNGLLKIGQKNPAKLAYLANAIRSGSLVSLENLLKSDSTRFSGSHMNVYYAASWGLVAFLLQDKEYARGMSAFLWRLRRNQDGISAFKDSFTRDLVTLDKRWRAWLLESSRPETTRHVLFDGTHIDDWTIHEGGNWVARDGIIEASGDPSYNYLIKSELPSEDFSLSMNVQVNSGTVGLILGNNFHGEYPYYYLIDLSHDKITLRRSYSPTEIVRLDSFSGGLPLDQWATVTVTVFGGRLLVSVNSVTVINAAEDRESYSLFGLYLYKATARFGQITLVTGAEAVAQVARDRTGSFGTRH